MKVLHIAETIKGGVATVLDQLLDDSRVESLAIIPDLHLNQVENKSKCVVFKRSGRDFLSFINLLIIFIKQLKDFKPDIVHIHSSFAGLICRLYIFLLFKKNVKVVYCPHAFSFLMDVSFFKKKFFCIIELFLSYVTDVIICTSNYEKEIAVKNGLNSNKIIVVYNGIKPPFNIEIINDPLLPKDKINILYVGRFDYQKAFDFVIELSENLSDKYYLTIVGDYVNDQKNDLPQSVNHIKWLNKFELASYYYYSDLVFMPSRWESFGLVAVEANSYGVPVLAANRSSLPEIIVHEKNGLIFNEFNVSKVIELIESYNKTDFEEMSERCMENYQSKFTTKIMLDNVFDLYKKLVIK